MTLHPLAGKPAPAEILIDPEKLVAAYYAVRPDLENPEQLVSFGTSGHRGSAEDGSFNEAHILATTQAICEYRSAQGISGPLYMGRDTHAASEPAERTALEVLAANGVETILQAGGGYTATPGISHAILAFNAGRPARLADGLRSCPNVGFVEAAVFRRTPVPARTEAHQLLRIFEVGAHRVVRGHELFRIDEDLGGGGFSGQGVKSHHRAE
jgi:phosphoglucomutase